jgi:hypothetical protein
MENGLPFYPPPESIAEMKVQSGMDSGAYGWASGANINLVTKSGTHNYHADLWEFLRNDDLNARSFFSPAVGRLRWNQFGLTAGGPLVIPHLLSKEKGWYVFGWYEGIRLPSTSIGYSTVPTAAEYAGDFSNDPPIYNPYTSVVSTNGTLLSRSPFVGNQIPAGATTLCSPQPTCFNSGAVTIAQGLLPPANLPQYSGPGGTDFVGTSSSDTTYDQWSTRVDHQFGKKDSFFGRYSDSRSDWTGVSFAAKYGYYFNYQRFTNISVSETHTFSSSFLLTIRYGQARMNWSNGTNGPDVADPAGMTAAFPYKAFGLNRIPGIYISNGAPAMGQGVGYYGPANLYDVPLDFQKIVGRNTLSFGVWYMRDHYKANNQSNSVVFSSIPTEGLTPGTGYGLASYFLGLPSDANRVIGNEEGNMITDFYSAYVQDSIRATRKLAFNLGMRYDYSPPAINTNGSATFVWETGQYVYDRKNPITGAPSNAPLGLIPPDKTNFQPRVGAAYQINPKTTARASYGIFKDIYGENSQSQQGNRGNWPYAVPDSIASENTGLPQYYMQNPFPPFTGPPTPLACEQCLEIASPVSRTPYVEEWTASVQRQLTPSMMVQAAYFGSHGIHQIGQVIDNTALYPGTDNYLNRVRWPNFPVYIGNGYNEYPSWYDGLSLELRKTYSHNLSAMLAYTYSKSMDVQDGLGVYNTAASAYIVSNRVDVNMRRGPASFNVPQRLTAAYTWDIPGKTGNKFADGAVAHWSFSGIVTYDSGTPYYVVMCADNANIGIFPGVCNTLTNLVGNPVLSHPTINEWFNTSAYQIPTYGTFGNAGKHALYSQSLANLDCALSKRWPFKETRNLEFRAEFFNAPNNVTFGYPGYVEDNPASFGKVSSTRQNGRQIQFALKLHF